MTLPLIYIRISRSLSFKEIKKERGVIVPIFKKTLIILSFIFLISILIYLNMYLFGTSTVGIYGVILITYLVIKLGLSFLYEPMLNKLESEDQSVLVNDLENFKKQANIIVTNRYDNELQDVKNKVYSRDIFNRD